MSETGIEKSHIRVVFRTSHMEYALADAKSFSIPGGSGPVELDDIIHALLGSSQKIPMNFFVGDALIQETLERTLADTGCSAEDIIEVFYSPKIHRKVIYSIPHDDWISSVVIVNDSLALTGSYDFGIRMNRTDAEAPSTLAKGVGHRGAITDVCLIGSGGTANTYQCASSSQDGSVIIWDYSSQNEFTQKSDFRFHHSAVTSLDYSHKHALLLSGGYDGTACVWNPTSAESPMYFRGHTNAITDCRYIGDTFVSGGMDGAIKEWNPSTSEEIASVDTKHAVFCLDSHADEPLLLAGHANCTINLIDLRAGKVQSSIREHSKWVYSVTFGEDRHFISTSEDKSLCFWDMRFLRNPIYRDTSTHADAVLAAAHCGGQRYITAGKDRRLVASSFA
ncbi:ribosome biogenesis protein wdr12-like protein [Perkinsela sp. CCAP 1560/4]|nr:ribosome biogenesis protein wdr12-like protein [Perkinsela sp. CCAP 1560/4]|eukprot:KNH07847.1 ribosome biogenesis protein wdr12-like protein [Perkinsela sp. CCAP 1560/4]